MSATFLRDVENERVRRAVMRLAHPNARPVAGTPLERWPTLIAEPVRPMLPGDLGPREAAEAVLELAESVAHLHGADVAGLATMPPALEPVPLHDGVRLVAQWPAELAGEQVPRYAPFGTIGFDVKRLVGIFGALQGRDVHGGPATPGPPLARPPAPLWSRVVHAVRPPLNTPVSEPSLSVCFEDMRRASCVAELGEALAEVSRSAARWRARIAKWPRITERSGKVDFNLVIELGERVGTSSRYVSLPLATAYHQEGSRRFAAGDPSGAAECFRRAVEIDPGFIDYVVSLATALDARGDPAAARMQLAVTPDDRAPLDARASAIEGSARARYVRGVFAYRDGHLARAMADLQWAARADPQPTYLTTLATVCRAVGEHEGALDASRRAMAIAPFDPRAVFGAVRALVALGHTENADSIGRSFVSSQPTPENQRTFAKISAKTRAPTK